MDNPASNVEWVLSEMLNQPEVLKKVVDEIARWLERRDGSRIRYSRA